MLRGPGVAARDDGARQSGFCEDRIQNLPETRADALINHLLRNP
jgi:hypothetical protein